MKAFRRRAQFPPQGLKALLIKLHSGSVHTVFEPAGSSWLSLLFSSFQFCGLSFLVYFRGFFFVCFFLFSRSNEGVISLTLTIFTGYKWIFKQPLHRKVAWILGLTHFPCFFIFIFYFFTYARRLLFTCSACWFL